MKKIILFIIFSFNMYSEDFYKTSKEYPEFFNEIKKEGNIYYSNNIDVIDYDFKNIDVHVFNVMKNYPNIKDMKNLSFLLSKPCKNDLEKVRSFYIWLIYNIRYDITIRTEYNKFIY